MNLRSGLAAVLLLGLTSWAGADNVIVNGDFSDPTPTTPGGGIPGWSRSGNPANYIADILIVPDWNLTPVPGPVAQVPGNSWTVYASSTLSQSVPIPRDALPARLTLYYQWLNGGPWSNNEYAMGTFGSTELFHEKGNGLLFQYTPTPGWTRIEKVVDLSPYAGSQVSLNFIANNPWNDGNAIWVDQISLDVITASPTKSPTITETATVSPTPSVSPTTSPTPTISATVTLTATRSATVTVTPRFIPVGEVLAFPNPARGDRVYFRYSLTQRAQVTIEIYNLLGARVAGLEDAVRAPGINQETTWDIRNVAPGVYLYQVTFSAEGGAKTQTKLTRLVIVK